MSAVAKVPSAAGAKSSSSTAIAAQGSLKYSWQRSSTFSIAVSLNGKSPVCQRAERELRGRDGGNRRRRQRQNLDGARDVLDLMRSDVDEVYPDLAAHLIVRRLGNADAAGLGQRFQPRRDVDAVAEDIIARDDDVADVDADAKLHRLCSAGR